jgi:hypothetical protein
MIGIVALVVGFSICVLVPNAAAQSDRYSTMAPVEQYLMERNAEILLARSAAPDSISSDATILILGRQGYETAVRGKNGFVCMVERSWMAAFDWPEFWNPKVRGAQCLNPQAARSILPIADLRMGMVMAGHSKAEILSAIEAAFDNKRLPDLEDGAMAFMMAKSAYLTDDGDHNGPHLMFFTALEDGKNWGAGASGSPVVSGPYWFLSSKEPSPAKRLPPILVFAVEVSKWSDGTAPRACNKSRLTTTRSGHLESSRLTVILTLCKTAAVPRTTASPPTLSPKELLILELLSSAEEMYGLELVAASGGALKRGTVYVTLGRMEDKGYVVSRLDSAPRVAGGLPRRVYAPTPLGREVLAVWTMAAAHFRMRFAR